MAANALMSCGVSTTFRTSFLSSSRSRFASFGASNASKSRFTMSAEWMPGEPRPSYLDGSAPGDFGFDPLRLGEVPENLERYKESELIHCRWAMLAVAQEWAAVPGGQATYLGNPVPWGTLPTILVIEFLAIAFVEHQRSMEKDPEKKKYPGGAFDPLGYSKDPQKLKELKIKEIKNGRLALLAFVGFCVQQSAYPGTGPLENLATHLADPWHNNIGDARPRTQVKPAVKIELLQLASTTSSDPLSAAASASASLKHRRPAGENIRDEARCHASPHGFSAK
ncbi:chlorophyll A/B binding protein [Striga asiatica]|uniref:Chlorophyll a-b binding protein, chloroplastic n=1 Tax=Striga asiatica TaxID=4170 RepID=A0A5A7R0S3_STRAF|nr:chlorophyll A/B binding protein [Striga asiatica]